MIEYPEWLEKWWVDRACRHYGVTRLEDCSVQLEKAVQKLSDTFTVERAEVLGDYQRDPELLLAYGLFYFPQTFARVQFPLMEMLERGWQIPADRGARILDLGSGAGAAGLGAAAVFPFVEGWALDQSQAALRIHAEIVANAPHQSWQQRRFDLRHTPPLDLQEFDLLIVSFALNELPANFDAILDSWLTRLHPEGAMLVLEPATKEISEKLEAYRDRIAAEKQHRIFGPCLHAAACPLLNQGDFWCHEVRRWSPPASLLLLNRHLHRAIDVLKFSFLAIGREAPVVTIADSAHFRLVSPFVRGKGKWIAAGCAADGSRHEYEILSRHLTPELKHKLQQLERGDVVRITNVQPAGAALRFVSIEQEDLPQRHDDTKFTKSEE